MIQLIVAQSDCSNKNSDKPVSVDELGETIDEQCTGNGNEPIFDRNEILFFRQIKNKKCKTLSEEEACSYCCNCAVYEIYEKPGSQFHTAGSACHGERNGQPRKWKRCSIIHSRLCSEGK